MFIPGMHSQPTQHGLHITGLISQQSHIICVFVWCAINIVYAPCVFVWCAIAIVYTPCVFVWCAINIVYTHCLFVWCAINIVYTHCVFVWSFPALIIRHSPCACVVVAMAIPFLVMNKSPLPTVGLTLQCRVTPSIPHVQFQFLAFTRPPPSIPHVQFQFLTFTFNSSRSLTHHLLFLTFNFNSPHSPSTPHVHSPTTFNCSHSISIPHVHLPTTFNSSRSLLLWTSAFTSPAHLSCKSHHHHGLRRCSAHHLQLLAFTYAVYTSLHCPCPPTCLVRAIIIMA